MMNMDACGNLLCGAKTFEYCTMCAVQFCSAKCMVLGWQAHTQDCIRFPPHSSHMSHCSLKQVSGSVETFLDNFKTTSSQLSDSASDHGFANEWNISRYQSISAENSQSPKMACGQGNTNTNINNSIKRTKSTNFSLNSNFHQNEEYSGKFDSQTNNDYQLAKESHYGNIKTYPIKQQNEGFQSLKSEFHNDLNRDDQHQNGGNRRNNILIDVMKSRLNFFRGSKIEVKITDLQIHGQREVIGVHAVGDCHALQIMEDYLAKEIDLKPLINPQRSDKCLVRFSEKYYRALVVHINPVQLRLMDSHYDQIPFDGLLLKMPEKYCSIPYFVYRMKFIDGTTTDNLSYFANARATFFVEIAGFKDQNSIWPVKILRGNCPSEENIQRKEASMDNGKVGTLSGRPPTRSDDHYPDDTKLKGNKQRPRIQEIQHDHRIPKGMNGDNYFDNTVGSVAKSHPAPTSSHTRRQNQGYKSNEPFRNKGQSNNSTHMNSSSNNSQKDGSQQIQKIRANNDVRQPKKMEVAVSPSKNTCITQDQANKSCDLVPYCDSLLGKIITVVVTYAEDDGQTFYVLDNEKLEDILPMLKNPNNTPLKDIIEGQMCLAFCEEIWNRARVVSVNPLKVYYLDFGNTDSIEQANLRVMDMELRKLPPLAMRARLQSGDASWITVMDSYTFFVVDKEKDGTLILTDHEIKKVIIGKCKFPNKLYVISPETISHNTVLQNYPLTPRNSKLQVGATFALVIDYLRYRVQIVSMIPLKVKFLDYPKSDVEVVSLGDLLELPDFLKHIEPGCTLLKLKPDPVKLIRHKTVTLRRNLSEEEWHAVDY